MALSPDDITKIGRDVAMGRDPDDMDYTGEERRVFNNIRREIAEIRKKNPNARIDVYGNIDGL